MIRERVSTTGVIRPLEDESDIPACVMPLEDIGVLNEGSIRRYLAGQALWEKKFAKAAKSIEERRLRSIQKARETGMRTMDKIKQQLHQSGHSSRSLDTVSDSQTEEDDQIDLSTINSKTVLGSRQWTWGWALAEENPPPSSIVARGDTREARRLGKFADRQLGPGDEEHSVSGNNLWSVIVETLARNKLASARPSPKEPGDVSEVSGTTPSQLSRRASGWLGGLKGKVAPKMAPAE